jgi:DNA-binding MarR family transcriptional regulator
VTDESEPLPGALSDRLGFLLGRAHLVHRAQAERALASLDLDPKELGALAVLADEGPLSQQRLGERQGIDRTTMVAVVDALEAKRLVARRRDPTDRRAYSLQATASGRRVLGQAVEATRGAEEEFLARIPAAERERLKELLRALISAG